MKEATSIILHLDSFVAVGCLTDVQAGILFKGILQYANTEERLETTDTGLLALFSMFQTQIDRDGKKYEQKCEKNRANANKRYAKTNETLPQDADASDGIPSYPNASLSNSKSKSKINDDKADAIIIKGELEMIYPFEVVWEMYGKNLGKEETLKAMWNALTEKDRADIFAYVPGYVASTPEVRYRKNFENFLSQRYWECHPLTSKNYGINQSGNSENESRKQAVYNNAAELIAEFSQAGEQSTDCTASAEPDTSVPNVR